MESKNNPELEAMTLEEALKIVMQIAERYEQQTRLAAAARADRKGKVHRAAKETMPRD